MARMTVSIPDDLLAGFKKEFPDVNIASVVRGIIIKKVEQLKRFEQLVESGEI